MANYTVGKNKGSKDWAAKRDGAKRASVRAATQQEAEKIAKQLSANSGGGEVRIKGLDGKIRDSDTVKPGHESSVKDRKY